MNHAFAPRSVTVCLRDAFALKQRRPPSWEPSPSPSQAFARFQKCAKCLFFIGGSGEIRTHGPLRIDGFQDRCNRPLCHASKFFLRRFSRPLP